MLGPLIVLSLLVFQGVRNKYSPIQTGVITEKYVEIIEGQQTYIIIDGVRKLIRRDAKDKYWIVITKEGRINHIQVTKEQYDFFEPGKHYGNAEKLD